MVAVKPSITGICRSISTASKGRIGGSHRRHRLRAIAGDLHQRAFVFQQLACHLLVVQVVFGHQQAHAGQPPGTGHAGWD